MYDCIIVQIELIEIEAVSEFRYRLIYLSIFEETTRFILKFSTFLDISESFLAVYIVGVCSQCLNEMLLSESFIPWVDENLASEPDEGWAICKVTLYALLGELKGLLDLISS